jgi:hypothetical protein
MSSIIRGQHAMYFTGARDIRLVLIGQSGLFDLAVLGTQSSRYRV